MVPDRCLEPAIFYYQADAHPTELLGPAYDNVPFNTWIISSPHQLYIVQSGLNLHCRLLEPDHSAWQDVRCRFYLSVLGLQVLKEHFLAKCTSNHCWQDWHFFDLVFVVGVKYRVKIMFPPNNFWRDALIALEVCRMVYHYSPEVKFDFGNHAKKKKKRTDYTPF